MIVIIDGKKSVIDHPRLEAIFECMLSAEAAGLLFRDALNTDDPVRFITHCGRDKNDVDIQLDMRFRPDKQGIE